MAVEQLRSWQHDIAERCTHLTERLFDKYMNKLPDTPDMMAIPNHVHRLRALVQYSMENEVRANLLLSLVYVMNKHLYLDLVKRGPMGKTERTLTQLKLTHAAERMIGSRLSTFHCAVRDRSFLDKITTVDTAVDMMTQEQLLLPDEEYMLYYMYKSTAGKVNALRRLFGCPKVPAVAKASISLILAVYNLHIFGICTNNPDSLLETVSLPTVEASVVQT